MRASWLIVGATVVVSLTTVAASAQERLQRARQECWAQMGYPNGPVGNNAMRNVDQVSACVRGKMAAGGRPGPGPQGGQGRLQR